MFHLFGLSLYLGSEAILPKSDATAKFYSLDYLRVCNLKL